MTYKGLGTTVGMLEVESLTNLTFEVLGVVSCSKYEVIVTSATGISIWIVPIKIRLVK